MLRVRQVMPEHSERVPDVLPAENGEADGRFKCSRNQPRRGREARETR